ncbi:MAG: hypothetical protein ACREPR_21960 [Brasilonema sp.]
MLSNKKSEGIHRLGQRARHTAQRLERSADALKAVVFKATAGLAAPVFAVAGWLTMTSSSMAVTGTYRNEFRVCAGRLLSVGIAADAASQACAAAIRPGDLSACVYKIGRQTQIAASDALATCKQARRPEEIAICVIGINKYNRETAGPEVLNYCGRSLLPVRFAECVVGLRAEVDFASTQAMESCIDASDKISGFLPSFVPSNRQPTEFRPTFESTPAPSAPSQTPAAPTQSPTNPSSK